MKEFKLENIRPLLPLSIANQLSDSDVSTGLTQALIDMCFDYIKVNYDLTLDPNALSEGMLPVVTGIFLFMLSTTINVSENTYNQINKMYEDSKVALQNYKDKLSLTDQQLSGLNISGVIK